MNRRFVSLLNIKFIQPFSPAYSAAVGAEPHAGVSGPKTYSTNKASVKESLPTDVASLIK